MGSAWWQCTACLRAQEEDICELQLNHCNLYDVPPDVFIYERTLEKLYLDANRIKDLPRPLFQCHELRVLSLSDNEVTTLPPAIASLINLEYLDLSKNSIKELPDSIKECKNLRSIDISVNPFERFPDAITHILGLRELYINDAYIEYLPANFGRLSSLKTLELRENNMMTLPKSMSRLVNLQRLDIGNNDFTELPEVVGDLINLTELWIDGNDIRRIPTNIEQLHRLNHFDCTMNSVHIIPSEVQGWRDISIMNLSSNEIYELPDSLCFLNTIVTLKIDDNQLNSLPNDIGQMSSLEELIVTKNFLEYLPSSIGKLRKLHCLNVDNNYLRCLPPEIGNCMALSLLSIRSNNLAQVPPELGLLSSLRVLNLVNNCIKFLPMSMLNLSNLKALWLSDNQSQPLVPLQQEFNTEENMMVLTCFMLPQKTRQDLEQMVPPIGPISTSVIGTGKRICFAAEVESEVPRQLHRAPTPYPKELRNLARHARNLHHQSTHDQRNPYASLAHINAQISKNHKNINSVAQETEHYNSEESSDEANKIVVATEKSPDIREAKCIRNPTSEFLVKGPIDYVNSTWRPDEYSKANIAKIVESEKFTVPYRNTSSGIDDRCSNQINIHPPKSNDVPPIPPPYHIAAAFSKKAAFFQQLNHAPPSDHRTDIPSQAAPSISNRNEISQSDHVQKSNVKDCTNSLDKNNTFSETKATNASLDNENKNSTDTREEIRTPLTETADSELTSFESDRSLKPSKIPILKTKHLESLSSSLKNDSSLEDNKPPQDISSIPTSPVTGKKYRSPLTMHGKFLDGSTKRFPNGTVSNSIAFDNSNMLDVTDSSIVANLKIDKENLDVIVNSANTTTSNFIQGGEDIKNDTSSGRSTPLFINHSKSSISLNNSDTKGSKIPVVGDPSTPERKPKLKWMFGPHKNANVLPVQVRKNPGLGFSIAGGVMGAGTGIIVTKVNPDGPAQGTLRPGDKILEVDGIDFTKSDHDNAVAVLRATGAVVSMMISRHQ